MTRLSSSLLTIGIFTFVLGVPNARQAGAGDCPAPCAPPPTLCPDKALCAQRAAEAYTKDCEQERCVEVLGLDEPKSLSPYEILLLSDMKFSVNGGETNGQTFDNTLTPPLKVNQSNTYSVGFGAYDKPLLKQALKAIDYYPKSAESGSLLGDLFFDAFTVDANVSHGKTITVQENGIASNNLAENTTFTVQGKYEVTLDKLWGHLVKTTAVGKAIGVGWRGGDRIRKEGDTSDTWTLRPAKCPSECPTASRAQ